jgi:CheY-like chemotaxis protein
MATGGFTVLVVDDSAMFRQRLSCLLHEFNLHPVLQAHDYEEASIRLLKTKIDLVLLDINLPGKSGIELLRMIRKNYPCIKVLMITNHANDHYKQVCMLSGADHFIDKSLDFENIGIIAQEIRDEIRNQN